MLWKNTEVRLERETWQFFLLRVTLGGSHLEHKKSGQRSMESLEIMSSHFPEWLTNCIWEVHKQEKKGILLSLPPCSLY